MNQQRVGFLGNNNTPAGIAAIAATPPSAGETPEYVANGAQKDPTCTAKSAAQPMLTTDPGDPYWQLRLSQGLRHTQVPIFWTQGRLDQDVKPSNFDDFWTDLRGPKRAWLGSFGHDNLYLRNADGIRFDGRDGYVPEAMRWFDHYLRGVPLTSTPDPQVEVEDGSTLAWRGEPSWPPADSTMSPLTVGSVTIGVSSDMGSVLDESDPGTGDGTWKISAPLPYDVHVSGVPELDAIAGAPGSGATLFVQLFDIDAKGQAAIISRGATLVTSAGAVTDRLFNSDWTVPTGHRIGVLIADDDPLYIDKDNGQQLALTGATMQIPTLKYARAKQYDSSPSYAQKNRHAPLDERTAERPRRDVRAASRADHRRFVPDRGQAANRPSSVPGLLRDRPHQHEPPSSSGPARSTALHHRLRGQAHHEGLRTSGQTPAPALPRAANRDHPPQRPRTYDQAHQARGNPSAPAPQPAELHGRDHQPDWIAEDQPRHHAHPLSRPVPSPRSTTGFIVLRVKGEAG